MATTWSLWCSSLQLAKGASGYSLYVLALLLLAYLLNQLDRYALAIVARPMAQEIHFGDQGCIKDENVSSLIKSYNCSTALSEDSCTLVTDEAGNVGCEWDFTGQGFDYQILAGPIFILIYTFAGIPIGVAADAYNRKILLGLAVFFWSLCTFLTGFVNSYWQLAALRFGLGLGQSACTPFATSLISDFFVESLRGTALGVYNWGIYSGYSMSYAIGNFITKANINGQGWRWTFFVAGIPGLFLGVLIMLTIKEPKRIKGKNEVETAKHENSTCGKLRGVLASFFRPSVLLLCFAGSIRNAAGYVWAYNTQIYFEQIGETREQIGFWLSWIPLVAGSIGVVVGGFISDRLVSKIGPHGRIWVLILSQILAAPFAAGALLLPTPYAYISLIPNYIIGEMWVSVTLAVLVELVPSDIKTTSVAVYFFIISNIGGNMPLMVPVLKPIFERYGYSGLESLRYTLLALFPGEYVIGSALFLLTLFVLQNDLAYIQSRSSRGSNAEIVANMENGSNSTSTEQNEIQEKELTKM